MTWVVFCPVRVLKQPCFISYVRKEKLYAVLLHTASHTSSQNYAFTFTFIFLHSMYLRFYYLFLDLQWKQNNHYTTWHFSKANGTKKFPTQRVEKDVMLSNNSSYQLEEKCPFSVSIICDYELRYSNNTIFIHFVIVFYTKQPIQVVN